MKKIQNVRTAVQILSVVLTATAILMKWPLFKLAILLTTLFGGVFYCGWICPFGFIQDIGIKLGRNLGIKRKKVPEQIHQVAVYARYLLLAMVALLTSDLLMQAFQYEPRGALLGLLSGSGPSLIAAGVIVFFFILSLKYDRFYCRYMCLEGARYGLVSMVRPFTILRHDDTCIQCGKCSAACPMQIAVDKVHNLRSPQCVNCYACISACPVDGALEYGLGLKKNGKEEPSKS